MTDRWQEISQLYHAALARDTGDRDAFLRVACAGDDALQREVESLLAHEHAAAPLIETPALEVAAKILNGTREDDASFAGRQIGPYAILSLVGVGGMGKVYRARDTKLGRDVAIKLLPPEFTADTDRRARFEREARLLAALNHPHIAQIHGLEEADGIQALVMELVLGRTLDEIIEGRSRSALGPGKPWEPVAGAKGPVTDRTRARGLPLNQALGLARQIADALEAAHEKGIIHRDLKPANIKITPDGTVKVLDFGLAKATTGDAPGPDLSQLPTMTQDGTRQGMMLGTPAYMSPEQARGQPVDKRTDIWAFGCVLYEMLTRRAAFPGDTVSDTIAKILEREPDWTALPPATPTSIRRLLSRCFVKDPKHRLRDIGDARAELDDSAALHSTIPAASAVVMPPWSDTQVMAGLIGRHRFLTSALGLIAMAAVGLGAWRLWPQPIATVPTPTVVPLTSLGGDEGWPTFSPDGNQVAFVWNGEKGDNYDIYIMPVGAGTPLRLTTDPADDVAPAWSPDGSKIAFVRHQGNAAAIYLTTPPAQNSEQKLADLPPVTAGDYEPTISWFPDGKRLAVAERDAEGQMNGIVMIPIDHGEPRRLIWTTTATGFYGFPTVSPTTPSVLGYVLCVDSWKSCDLHVLELTPELTSKGPPRRLTEQNTSPGGMAWTPDGRTLIYGSGYSPSYLWRVPLVGGPPERLELAGDHARNPAVSRGHPALAYTRVGSDFKIWKFDSIGPPKNFLSSTLDDRNPQFSPDGKKIAFESRRLGKGTQLWIANADGTNPTPLTEGTDRNEGSPRWSADSRRIVFDGVEPDGREAIYVVEAEGGQPHRLTTLAGRPSWSHDDSKWIYFDSNRTGRNEVWRISATGAGTTEKMTDKGGRNPLESPDGKTLYYFKLGAPGVLFSRPVAGGPERPVLDSMPPGVQQYFPVEDGIYYVAHPDPTRRLAFEVRFLNFTTGKHETLNQFEMWRGYGLSVSPDRKTILYSGVPIWAGDNLMLIRNFR